MQLAEVDARREPVLDIVQASAVSAANKQRRWMPTFDVSWQLLPTAQNVCSERQTCARRESPRGPAASNVMQEPAPAHIAAPRARSCPAPSKNSRPAVGKAAKNLKNRQRDCVQFLFLDAAASDCRYACRSMCAESPQT